jgi:thiosulfate dehydrogenase [quinone] large subunit
MGNASWIGSLDLAVSVGLTVVGASLMLGLFTQFGCGGALALLSTFYLAAVPTGTLDARAEGTYLLVNKNLIEACAAAVLFAFRTGSIAGLDRLWLRPPLVAVSTHEAAI